MVLRIKNWGFSENSGFYMGGGGGGFIKDQNQYKGERWPKKGGTWTVCWFKWGLGKKAVSGVFEGGGETPMHTMVLCS